MIGFSSKKWRKNHRTNAGNTRIKGNKAMGRPLWHIPDGQPILGPVPEIEGYYLALGCGKGFMLALYDWPVTAEYLVEETSLPIDILSIERFAKGELINEPSVV